MTELHIPSTPLAGVLARIFEAAGASASEAQAIADNLVEASLKGHDSHGVARTQKYIEWVGEGAVHFGKHIESVLDGGAFALLDGQLGFGQVVGREAVEIGLAKAREHGVAVIGLRRAGHLGRIGAWAEMACEAGLVSVHFVNVYNSLLVAPFGGAERVLSTAPVCIGVPNGGFGRSEDKGAGDFVLDFATSRIAEGKAMIAYQAGTPTRELAFVTPEGAESDDPAIFYGRVPEGEAPDASRGTGALAAMGAHKGSGLGIACELLAGALTGSGAGQASEGRGVHNGMLSLYLDPARFDDGHGYGASVRAYVETVRRTRPGVGVASVAIPGDIEHARETERRRNGLPLSEGVWDSILAAGEAVGLERSALERMAQG
ncbi:MAG: Ldh family oxidoreductase [Pseudomonadota bacterium]